MSGFKMSMLLVGVVLFLSSWAALFASNDVGQMAMGGLMLLSVSFMFVFSGDGWLGRISLVIGSCLYGFAAYHYAIHEGVHPLFVRVSG